MLKILTGLFLVLSTSSALAFTLTPENELCAVASDDIDVYMDSELAFDIKKDTAVTSEIENLILKYYQESYRQTATFEEIRKSFISGEESYNDMYVYKYTSKATGKVYIEIRTYPGDNADGLIYSAETGAVIGSNDDGDYSLTTPKGNIWCSEVIGYDE